MARQVEDIFIRLGVQGFENLDRVKSSFRDLGKVTNMAEADVMSVRDRLLEYAKTAGNTEAANKGLISAFQGLRSQVDMCGSAYDELTQDLRRFSEVQQGATTAFMRNRDELVRNFSETTRNIRALREHRDALIAIQAETRQYSRANDVLSNDIAQVRERIEEVTTVTKTYNQVLTRVAPGTAAGASRRNEQLKEGIQLQRDIINEIDLLPSKERKAAAAVNERAAAVEKLNQGLAQQRILSFQERARAGRESVRAGAAAFANEELTVGYLSAGKIQRRLGELPNTTAGLNQELSELSERLVNTTRHTDGYIAVALRMATVQRELKESTLGVAAAFVQQLRAGEIAPSLTNLREVISSVRTQQGLLDTSSTGGARAFQLLELQARSLERQLRALQSTQANLAATPTSGFAAFSQSITASEADRPVRRSIERARKKRGILSPEDTAAVESVIDAIEKAEIEADNAIRKATARNTDLWVKDQQRKNEEADRLSKKIIENSQREADEQVAAFDRVLAARDRFNVSKQFTKQYLGLSGQELSPFYEQVVNLGVGQAGTAASKYQKRDFSRVLTDTVEAFNLQLTEASRTAVEGMGQFKESAIAYAGGSKRVRAVLDRYEANAIPEHMFPFVGETGKQYEKRITEDVNLFSRAVSAFNRILDRSGDSLSASTNDIRTAAVDFAQQAGRGPEVSAVLKRYGAAGAMPMHMLPKEGDTPEAYTSRILGDKPVTLPELGDVRQSSLTKLQNLRGLLEEIRGDIPPIAREFSAVEKQITRDLRSIDAELSRRQRRTDRRTPLSGMQLAQGVGAALSGGIFGGPAGLVGGLGGLAVGGVGGAFAGAAYGAQIGMFGQQLAATTDYSAQIDKLQIALRGIVGTQDAYNSAMAAATAATQQLNVPQETAIQGMTRLSAAVLGAGGTVNDSAFAFRTISEAIKATGGNAEQVDGALLALTQVFSKGKVSAEELNQIAERLPGTFTLFAQAAGKSGPELQKALQQGQVGLADLMAFMQLLSNKYKDTALTIAQSSQDAGARLSIAFQQMRLEIGAAIQPLGAEIQTTFGAFIKDITPAAVASVKAISSAFEFFTGNQAVAGIGSFALKLGAVALAVAGVRAAFAALTAINVSGWFAGVSASAKFTGDTMAVTSARAAGLLTAIKGLAAIGALTIVVDIFIKNYMQLMAAKEALDKLRGQRDPVGPQGPRLIMTAERRYAGASREKVIQDIELQREYVAKLRKDLQKLEEDTRLTSHSTKLDAAGKLQANLIREQIRNAEEVINLDVRKFKTREQIEQDYLAGVRRRFAAPAADGEAKDKAAKKAKSDADSIAAHQQRLAETELDQRLRLEDTIYKHGVELDRKRYELQKNLSDLQVQNRIAKETGVSRDILSNFYQFQQDLRALTERRRDAERAVEDAKRAASSAAARAALSGQMPPSVSGTGAYKPGAFSRRVRDPDAERTGYDIVHPGGLGAPVRTPVALTITGTGFQGRGAGPKGKGYGNWISGEFELGGKKYEMVVGHFGQIDVAPGMKVPAGGSLGTQGITGRAFGAHATTHVNPKAGATTADAWNALDSITTALQQGRTLGATKLPTGVGAQQLRAIKQGGKAKIEQADVAKAEADLALIKQNEAKEAAALAEKFTISITQNLREQNQALIESNQLQALKNRLSYEGFSPERIELELSLEKQRLDLAKAGAAFAQARAYVTGLENISDDEKTRRLAQLSKDQGEYNDHMRTYIQLLNEAYIANQNYNQSVGTGFREGLSKYVESVGTMREATAQLTQTGIKGLEDALFSLVTTGTANFQEFAASILRDTARMILQLTIQKVIMQILGAINPAAGAGAGFSFGGSSGGFNLPGFTMPSYMAAKGGAFGKNGIVPFAYGGIVNKPTLFQFANGGTAATGLLGEAGPEAILPLRRGPSGRLGVETSGAASSMNVTVNVDASGTKAEGDGGRAEQLGRVVSQAVQAELIKQKRPGGLLA